MNKDEKWMRIAIKQAILAKKKGEVPVGAVLVQNDKIIAKAHNCPISSDDPTAHAEILVLRKAGKKLQNYRLPEASLYVTLEPCLMCTGAIKNARISRVIFGALESKNLTDISSNKYNSSPFINNNCKFEGGILKNECKELLQTFFRSLR